MNFLKKYWPWIVAVFVFIYLTKKAKDLGDGVAKFGRNAVINENAAVGNSNYTFLISPATWLLGKLGFRGTK